MTRGSDWTDIAPVEKAVASGPVSMLSNFEDSFVWHPVLAARNCAVSDHANFMPRHNY